MSKADKSKLESFQQIFLRKIFKIYMYTLAKETWATRKTGEKNKVKQSSSMNK